MWESAEGKYICPGEDTPTKPGNKFQEFMAQLVK